MSLSSKHDCLLLLRNDGTGRSDQLIVLNPRKSKERPGLSIYLSMGVSTYLWGAIYLSLCGGLSIYLYPLTATGRASSTCKKGRWVGGGRGRWVCGGGAHHRGATSVVLEGVGWGEECLNILIFFPNE